MHIKDTLVAVVGAAAASVLAAPAGHELQARQVGIPTLSFTGVGAANANVVVGGGILPTWTIGAALAANSDLIAAALSNTFGFGGGQLPTALIGGGIAGGLASSNAIVEGSATLSEGGWLNNIIPAFQAGAHFNNLVGVHPSSPLGLQAGGAIGAGATLGYGGNFIDPSNLAIDFGLGYGASFVAGPIPTSSSSSTAAPTTT
ncbi:hypothetical protein H4R19_006427 [Coemansia spiralis]|nr:hypothetical protein H4R19_006427 [Coemansia spiralis]